MASQTLIKVVLGGGIGILTCHALYKSKTDPVHIFWDLDHTILCSIYPITELDNDTEQTNNKQSISKCPVSPSNLIPSSPKLQYFDQIDDDFDIPDDGSPNTRTFIRPGAQMALKICNMLGIIHVYTAAQESYTYNILNILDPKRTLFTEVIHRCDYPKIVTEGKDLSVVNGGVHHRSILFDDKESNFLPQKYENGVLVKPFNSECVANCDAGSWTAYIKEVKEMSRLVCIALYSSLYISGDVRTVVGWVSDKKDTTTKS